MATMVAVGLSLGSAWASADATHPVSTQRADGFDVHATNASPNSVLDLAMNGGKVGEIKTDPTGTGTSILDFANMGKVQVQVFVERCEDGKIVRIQMVVVGETVPADQGCDRKPVGFFWTHNVETLSIDVGAGLMQVETSGLSGPIKVGIGAAVAAGAAIALTSGGGDSSSTSPGTGSGTGSGTGTGNPQPSNPAGNYPSTVSVQLDPGNHRAFIALAPNVVLVVSLSGSNMTVAGPSGSNWVTMSGTFDTASGSATLVGSGVVAGISNVSVRLALTISSSGALAGTLTMGANGELPGGMSTVYNVMGQRQ
jgi:hypothetical protein